jgi:protein-serine/threonine kinase
MKTLKKEEMLKKEQVMAFSRSDKNSLPCPLRYSAA